MASLAFSATMMDDIRAAMRQQRLTKRPPLAPPQAITNHPDELDGADVAMNESEVCEAVDHQAVPCCAAQRMFDSWVQDLDDQTLPELDNDELRILHALLFGAGDDAFAVADELLKQPSAV